jgi:hypothetical protein
MQATRGGLRAWVSVAEGMVQTGDGEPREQRNCVPRVVFKLVRLVQGRVQGTKGKSSRGNGAPARSALARFAPPPLSNPKSSGTPFLPPPIRARRTPYPAMCSGWPHDKEEEYQARWNRQITQANWRFNALRQGGLDQTDPTKQPTQTFDSIDLTERGGTAVSGRSIATAHYVVPVV